MRNHPVQLQNENVSSARMITLSSPNLTDENSFETPQKFIPVETSLAGIAGNNFTLEVKPYSINVIRLKKGKQHQELALVIQAFKIPNRPVNA